MTVVLIRRERFENRDRQRPGSRVKTEAVM